MKLVFVLLLVRLLSSAAAALDSSASSEEQFKFITLKVQTRRNNVAVASAHPEEQQPVQPDQAGGFSVPLLHRDSPASPLRAANSTSASLLLLRLQRDHLRSRAIAATISLAAAGFTPADLAAGTARTAGGHRNRTRFSSPVTSGIAGGSGDYFARIGVGTPSRSVFMVADTGSDISWLQCAPCRRCYQQQDPIFNPSLSSTFKQLPCTSRICSQLKIKACSSARRCVYQVSYGDGSFTLGDFSTERLTFGDHPVDGVALGCGRNNQGLFHGAAGLLGLGRGSLSFPSQNGREFSGVFSYCLPRRESTRSASLVFGAAAVPRGAAFTPLVPNRRLDTYYYVALERVTVGGRAVRGVPEGAFRVGPRGTGGVIIDSGTAITRLTTPAYEAVRDAFSALVGDGLPAAPGVSLFDTCYDLSGISTARLPAVGLEFEGGAAMALPAEGILVNVDDEGTYCLAFAPEDEGFSIIGNVQQQTFRISIDNHRQQMGIAPDQCS